jgi:hypothetical protein
MNTKQIFKIGIIATVILIGITFFANLVSFNNREIELRNAFEQKYQERTAFYDKMWKTLSQKSQITLKNDSSFRENVNIIMAGRKDAPQVFMKWITESNPNANYSEVSILYQDLSRAVEAQREGFFVQEKYMQDIVMQHSNLIGKFPNSFYNMFFGRQKLIYKPITSTITDEVIKTGKDDNVKLF